MPTVSRRFPRAAMLSLMNSSACDEPLNDELDEMAI
jgi:hypothetical protein